MRYVSEAEKGGKFSPAFISFLPSVDISLSQCDLQQPSCGQCSKAKLNCGGYKHLRHFINTTSDSINALHNSPTGLSDVAPLSSPSLSSSAYQEQYLSLFWDSYLGAATAQTSTSECLSRFPIGTWRSIARDIHHQDDLAKRSVLAIALGTLGRKHEEPQLAKEGLKLYVGALNETRGRLGHPTKWKADGLLLACSALGLFEVS